MSVCLSVAKGPKGDTGPAGIRGYKGPHVSSTLFYPLHPSVQYIILFRERWAYKDHPVILVIKVHQ